MKLLDILTEPWAIVPAKLKEIVDIYNTHLKGEKIDINIFKEATNKKTESLNKEAYTNINGVAVIDIMGVISKRLTFFSWMFGGTSTLEVAEALKLALKDNSVKAIILNIDSPGGTMDGTMDLAELIYSARGQKPIIAFSDGMIASGAYWVGSSVDAIFISSDTVQVGSVGVVATHIDFSQALEQAGLKVTEIVAGKYKRVDSVYKPLSEEGSKVIQDKVDYIFSVFVNSIAKNRDVSIETVLKIFSTETLPPIFIGRQAIDAGMVDGMTTFDQLLNRLADGDSADTLIKGRTIKSKEVKSMDLKELKEKHPDLHQSVFDEGFKAGALKSMEEGKSELDVKMTDARQKGAEDERIRNKAVKDQLMPGHEALIESLMFDGKTSGEQAAVKVLTAEKELLKVKAENYKADGMDINAVHVISADDSAITSLPIEERAKKIWDGKPEIRDEFKSFETYLAYLKAEESKLFKILNK